MKFLTLFTLCFALVGVSFTQTVAQSKKTIILVRHAEKDAVQSEMSADPELSAEGKQRAERLAERVRKYKPGAIYSTDYRRTRDTAGPMAKRRNLQVQIYDPKKQSELVEQVMKSKTKRFLVVGHSNSIPALANLLIKKELFKNLDDNEYGTIWIIRIKNGKAPKVELVDY